MSNFDAKKALMEVLAPEDDGPAGSAHHADAPALPSLDQRVDLFLRAMHGSSDFSAQERAAARLRILDAMADDLVPGSSAQGQYETVARVAPARDHDKGRIGGSTMLAGAWEVLREALLFPLTLSAGQPMRLVGAACAVLLVVGGGWTGAWFYVAHKTETAIASLIDSEAKAGRVYNCGSRSVGGFPLHVEVDCTALRAQLAMSDQTTLHGRCKIFAQRRQHSQPQHHRHGNQRAGVGDPLRSIRQPGRQLAACSVDRAWRAGDAEPGFPCFR